MRYGIRTQGATHLSTFLGLLKITKAHLLADADDA